MRASVSLTHDLRTNTCRREIDKLGEEFQELGNRVESNYGHIHRLTQDHGVHGQQLLDMRRDLNKGNLRRNAMVTQGTRPALNLKLPTFSGKMSDKPLQFSNALSKYIRATDIAEDNLQSILDQALQATAHDWWEFVENRVVTFEDFRARFLDRYWNDSAQERVRRELFEGRYRRESNSSMADYALQIYNRARYIDDAPSETGIVKRLRYHFDRDVQRALDCRQIIRIEELIATLEDLDQIEQVYHAKENYKTFNGQDYKNSNFANDNNNQNSNSHKSKNHAPNQNWRNSSNNQFNSNDQNNERYNENKPYHQRQNKNNFNQQQQSNAQRNEQYANKPNDNNFSGGMGRQTDPTFARNSVSNPRMDNHEVNQINIQYEEQSPLDSVAQNEVIRPEPEN